MRCEICVSSDQKQIVPTKCGVLLQRYGSWLLDVVGGVDGSGSVIYLYGWSEFARSKDLAHWFVDRERDVLI